MALQNVKSFGTEGRSEQPVAASEAVHPYMVFRGQDIQDLHVHEDVGPTEPAPPDAPQPPAPQPVAEPTPNPSPASNFATNPPISAPEQKPSKPSNSRPQPSNNSEYNKGGSPQKANRRRRNENNGPRRNDNSAPRRNEIGTGASLLNVRSRGQVVDREADPQTADFDLAAQTDTFQKEEIIPEVTAYQKDDFFDSLSCDTTDKLAGTDNRLRGHTERKLNTETFGAVALDSHRIGRGRGRGGRGRGRGRGGRGRRGGGRGGRQTAVPN